MFKLFSFGKKKKDAASGDVTPGKPEEKSFGVAQDKTGENNKDAKKGGDVPVGKQSVASITVPATVEGELQSGVKKPESKKEEAGNKISIIKLVDALLAQSFVMGASDIHIDPEENRIRIRLRIDGMMTDKFIFPKSIHSEVITRIKVMAGLRTDEHQMAQDGRLKVTVPNQGPIDVRVSIAPTYYGENCVMRLLSGSDKEYTLENLGFSGINLTRVQKAVEKPYGMILATGPTGSGKTTTLYTILRKLNTPDVSIITIEDPIEYSISGLEQVQVNERTGLVFAKGLRFILRQDPDIIMVGEIRDDETANIAVNAAMTGHLLLSTLHTNDATTTLPRLLDMGVEPFLIASTLNIAIGQRLIRTLCQDCKKPKKLTKAEVDSLKGVVPAKLVDASKDKTFYEARGCGKCGQTGFLSRIGIHEVLEVDSVIRELIMRKASGDEIRQAAVKNGMVTMLEDGFEKALKGLTTIQEVLRVFHE